MTQHTNGAAADDWDEGPPKRSPTGEPTAPAKVLKGLTREQITQRHLMMLDELTEQMFPLADEYLTVARAIQIDAPGRQSKVNTGCKLAKTVNTLIMSAERIARTGGK